MKSYRGFPLLPAASRSWSRIAAALVTFMLLVQLGVRSLPDWRAVKAHENYWIAQGLVRGEGFSLPEGHRWLYDQVDSDPYLRVTDQVFHPSAWADPVYTGIIAVFLVLFPERFQLAALLLNLGLLVVTCWATYRLGEITAGPVAGLLAVVILYLDRSLHVTVPHMVSGTLVGALVAVAGLALVSAVERPQRATAAVLGLVLGVTVLAGSGTQLFVPAAAVILLWAGKAEWKGAAGRAAIAVAVSVAVVVPWTARNWIRFGELVPVRTGGGQIAFVGVVGAASAVAPDLLTTRVPPPWRARTPREAVQRLGRWPYTEIVALEEFQLAYAEDLAPAGYGGWNEARRDAWFMAQTRAFIRRAPGLSARLAVAKIELFARRINRTASIAALLAPLALLFGRGNPAVLGLGLWVGAYLVPFLLIVPYYERYRAPIEPLIAVLAAYSLWHLGRGAIRPVFRYLSAP